MSDNQIVIMSISCLFIFISLGFYLLKKDWLAYFETQNTKGNINLYARWMKIAGWYLIIISFMGFSMFAYWWVTAQGPFG